MLVNVFAMRDILVTIVELSCAHKIVTIMLVHAMTVSASVTRDGVVHIAPCVNASVVACMAVAIMVYASVLQDGVVPTATSKTVLAIVTEMVYALTAYAHVNLTGLAHLVIKDYAPDCVADMVSVSKKMLHVCVLMSLQDLHVICLNARRK